MLVELLNKYQLTELKQFEYCKTHPNASYDELIFIDDYISDEEIRDKYDTTNFVSEDFAYRMSEKQEKFFVENKDSYIKDFIEYWKYNCGGYENQFINQSPEFEFAFKDFMWNWKNIDWLDFDNDIVKTFLSELSDILEEIIETREEQKREENLERKLNRSIDDEY